MMRKQTVPQVKSNLLLQMLVIGIIFSSMVFFEPVHADIGISYLEMEDIDWIAPHLTQVGLGYDEDFIYAADGSMQIITIDTEDYSDSVMYLDNSTSSWSTPIELADPQYGAMNLQILTDAQNCTHVCYKADGGGFAHLNNSGIGHTDWTTEYLPSHTGGSFTPRMAIGPDNVAHFVAYWFESDYNSYTGGLFYVNNSALVSHQTNNSNTRFEQFPDIAVDSMGMIHIVYEGSWNNTLLGEIAVRDIFYQSFNPFVCKNQWTDPIRLTDVQSTADYAQRPRIVCDKDDNLHVVLIETEPQEEGDYTVHRNKLKYMRIDQDPSSADLVTLNTDPIFGDTPSLAVDSQGDLHITYVGYPQTETTHYYSTDIMYVSNRTGDWIHERITNQPYTVGFPKIAIHPLTDDPTILYLIKQEYSPNHRTMEYTEYVKGEFGKHCLISSFILGKEDTAQIIEEEAYQYILLTPNEPLQLKLEIFNSYDNPVELDLSFTMRENDFVSLENGTLTQNITTITSETTFGLEWWFSISRGESSEMEIQVFHDNILIGKIIYMFNIGSANNSIPFASVMMIAVCFSLSIWLLISIRKKRMYLRELEH